MKTIIFHLTGLVMALFCSLAASAADPAGSKQTEQIYREAKAQYANECYPEALTLYVEAMEQAEKEGNTQVVTACLGYISNIYNTFGDGNACRYYLLKGYEAAKRTGDRQMQMHFLPNLVKCLANMGEVAEARKYYAVMTAMPVGANDLNGQYYSIYSKALILSAEHRYAEAIAEHRRAIAFAREKKMDPLFCLYQLSEIGDVLVHTGRASEAVAIGDTCMSMSRELGSRELLLNAYKMQADAYLQLQQTANAKHYRDLYFNLKDSVYETQKFYKARYKLNEYENNEHQQQMSLLNRTISHRTYVILIMAVLIIMALTLVYIITVKNRHLRRTQRLLIKRNADLEERENQNNIILKKYLEQARLNQQGQPADEAAATPADTQPPADSASKPASPSTDAARQDDTTENLLLSQINDVLNDTSTITNPDFSLQMLADMVGSNTTYVSRVINNSYHKNFKTLLNERRIREACHKLKDKRHVANFTMQTIYEDVGYKSASSFIRAFKKMYNMTPSEYLRLSPEEEM